jgi:hypothetical protein
MPERFRKRAAAVVDFGEAADRRQVFGSALQDLFELGECAVEIVQLNQRSPERHARGEITGVKLEARMADVDRLLKISGAAALLRQLREGDRRRVLLNPAPEILDAAVVRHGRYETGTLTVVVAVAPVESVTVNRTT